MIKFSKLGKKVNLIERFLSDSENEFCDLSFGSQFMWREEFICDYAIFNDTLIIKESCPFYKDYFYYPIGKDVDGAIREIENYCLENGLPLNFCCIDNFHASVLSKRYSKTKIENDRNWSDYIYDAQSFCSFKGKKYSGQRNHINKFKKLYPNYVFREIKKEDVKRLKEFLKLFEKENDFSSWTAREEEDRIAEYLDCFFNLNGQGGLIEVEGKIVAFSIGERVNDTLIIHVEKALREYEGVYPTIANEFCKHFAVNGVNKINREEDCGDMGLRISKLQYHPIEIKEKNTVNVILPIDRIKNLEKIDLGELEISTIKRSDSEVYRMLYMDEKVNKYYGYDYKEDLTGEPTKEYFYNFQNGLKEKENEYSFAVKKNNELIGEVVCYNFDFDYSCEIGYRFFESFWGKGYATKSVTALIKTLNSFGIKTIKAKVIKGNEKSINLLKKLKFHFLKEDEKYIYFNL